MSARELAPILPEALYPKPVLQRVLGWGDGALSEARRAGLVARYVHGRSLFLGADVIRYVVEHGKAEKDAAR